MRGGRGTALRGQLAIGRGELFSLDTGSGGETVAAAAAAPVGNVQDGDTAVFGGPACA